MVSIADPKAEVPPSAGPEIEQREEQERDSVNVTTLVVLTAGILDFT